MHATAAAPTTTSQLCPELRRAQRSQNLRKRGPGASTPASTRQRRPGRAPATSARLNTRERRWESQRQTNDRFLTIETILK